MKALVILVINPALENVWEKENVGLVKIYQSRTVGTFWEVYETDTSSFWVAELSCHAISALQ